VAGASSSLASSSGNSSKVKISIAAVYLILCLLYLGTHPRLSINLVFNFLPLKSLTSLLSTTKGANTI
jgi:hypothetical protein